MGFWSYVRFKDFCWLNFNPENWGCFMIRIDLKYTYCWIGWGNTTNSFFNLIQTNFDDFDVCPICVFNTVIVDPALNGFRFGRHLYSGLEGPVHGLVVVLPSNSERRLKSKTSICCGTFERGYSSPGSLTAKNLSKIGQTKPLIGNYRWWQLKYFPIFTPNVWGNDPIWRAYFSNGLVETTNMERIHLKNHHFSGVNSLLNFSGE